MSCFRSDSVGCKYFLEYGTTLKDSCSLCVEGYCTHPKEKNRELNFEFQNTSFSAESPIWCPLENKRGYNDIESLFLRSVTI